MTTTWIGDAWPQSRRIARTRHVHYWISVFGLGAADGLCFIITQLLFRMGANVPTIILFVGRTPNRPSTPLDVFALLALAFIAVRYLSGDYGRRQLFWDGAKITTIALLIASIPDIVMLAVGGGMYAPAPVIGSWLFLIVTVPVLRQMARKLMTRLGIWQIPTAMIGIGPRAVEIHAALKKSLSLGFNVRWLVIEDPESEMPESLAALTPVLSSDAGEITSTIWSAGCKQAIVSAEDMQSAHFAEVAQRLLEADIPVAIIPTLNRLPLAGVTTNYFFGRDILLLQVRSNVQRLPWRMVKRGFDLIGSVLLLLLFSPLFFIVAIAIKRASPGDITYAHRRIGRHGISFECLKFRTMVSDADEVLCRWSIHNPELYEEYLKTFKLRDDPRVTPIGRWLRRTSLDELPQLWNVLRGDMSLVGPRPVVAQELDEYYGPAAQLYVRTRPGLTGLWQVSGRSDTSYERRIFLDEWYILNWSFWYDIVILIQTAWIVATGKGAF
ncbi:MAG TPA: undecaprenyl-phosphate galactose phosphotransferase WbaP [Rhizomicrobium sp.]|jgi:undecaprenyl-phosphate galactose phosphotransferase|nr:undecaprenyl-phosphate galactose phosphotransferase WbaP [Rhizomicrobium sp.]